MIQISLQHLIHETYKARLKAVQRSVVKRSAETARDKEFAAQLASRQRSGDTEYLRWQAAYKCGLVEGPAIHRIEGSCSS